MNIRHFLPLVLFYLTTPIFAADAPPTVVPIKSGRYILIMYSASHDIPNPAPIFVKIKAAPGGGLTIEPEKNPKGATAMQAEGNSLVFSFTTPGDNQDLPPEGQDWFVAHVHSFAGKLSQRLPNTIEGVFSDIAIYSHPTSGEPNVFTGNFSLIPVDAD